ncbi:MAG: manganese efflux pump MntP family protein, partial [Candidatus Dormibacteraeota bacterium]|nr:manganese efflux pump MntP family protein [Candidatus Dormibacteraeota bacterium]
HARGQRPPKGDPVIRHVLVLAGLILPLALDTFALAAALGVAGIAPERRQRTSLVLAGFEAGMPIVGFLVGGAVGHLIGYFAGWTAIAFLVVAGALMLRPGDEEKEEGRLRLLAKAQGFAIIDLGLAISVDELAIGFSIGLLGLPLLVAVLWIGVQAFLAAQLGMRIGARLGEELRERAEQLAGVALIAMAGVLVVLKLGHGSV